MSWQVAQLKALGQAVAGSVPFTTALAALAIAEPTSHVETPPDEMPAEEVPAALTLEPDTGGPSWDDFAPEDKDW